MMTATAPQYLDLDQFGYLTSSASSLFFALVIDSAFMMPHSVASQYTALNHSSHLQEFHLYKILKIIFPYHNTTNAVKRYYFDSFMRITHY